MGFAGGGAVEEFFSGGYDEHPWKYRPRVRYKFKDEEEKKVAKIVEDVTERQLEITEIDEVVTTRDLEISIRLNLRLQGLIFKQLYMQWIQSEVKKIRAYQKAQKTKKRRRKEIELVILMLH